MLKEFFCYLMKKVITNNLSLSLEYLVICQIYNKFKFKLLYKVQY